MAQFSAINSVINLAKCEILSVLTGQRYELFIIKFYRFGKFIRTRKKPTSKFVENAATIRVLYSEVHRLWEILKPDSLHDDADAPHYMGSWLHWLIIS